MYQKYKSIILLISILFMAGTLCSTPKTTNYPSEVKTKKIPAKQAFWELDGYVQNKVKEEKFSGTILVAKKNNVLFKKAYGQASKRYDVPNRIDTKFNIGSMNKMFTAVAIAQLVEKGKLDYNHPISRYLDESWVKKEFAQKIQVKHLLSHTSGLGSYFNDEFMNSSRLRYRKLEDFKSIVKDGKLRFEPGKQWAYSNSGIFLLGVIIEKVSGKDYFQYIRRNIYEPAGMINSDSYDITRPTKNLATGYYKENKDGKSWWSNNTLLHTVKGGPAGGGYSTVEDLLKFAQALQNNKLISAASKALLTSVKPELNSPKYGFGFGVSKIGKEIVYGHSGGFPGIQAILRVYSKSGYVYAILSNYSGGMRIIKSKMESLLLSINQ